MEVRKITSDDIRKYRNQVLKSASASTFDRKVFSLKKFFDWAIKEGYLDENPVEAFLKAEEEIIETKLGKIEKQKKAISPSYGSTQARIIANLAGIPKLQKLAYNLFYTRPKWYVSYHRLPIASYFNLAILMILMSGLGFGIYNQFFKTTSTPLAYPTTLTTAGRFLSFQGRLTNNLGNPITVSTNLVFKLYNVDTGGTALWNSSSCAITPDTDGIFSTLLGSSCGTEIPASVFSENSAIWLGVTVETDTEATPRVQIATVAYALNSETLQGFPASMSATANTIPAINSSGYLVLGSSSPKIQSTSGNFAIEGQTMTINTPNTSNGSITINPDGTGTLNLTFEGAAPGGSAGGFVNATNANITSGALYYGSVASGATGYNLLQLQSGATPTNKFVVDYAGNITASGTINGLTVSSGTISSGTWNGTAISTTYGGTGQNWSAVAQGSIPYFNGTGTMSTLAPTTSGYVLTTQGTGANPIWTDAGSLGTNYWSLGTGTIYPGNTTLDLLLGSSATSSAKFAFKGVGSGVPTASISGTTAYVATYLDGNGNLSTTNMNNLTLGSSTTGSVIINSRGTNSITANGNSTSIAGTLNLSGNSLSSSGDLTINAGGGDVNIATSDNLNLTASTNLIFGGTTSLGETTAANDSGAYLVGAFDDFTYSASTNVQGVLKDIDTKLGTLTNNDFWQLNSNVLSPANHTAYDLAVGGTATSTAKFQVLASNGNIISAGDASVSGSLTFRAGAGSIQATNMAHLTLGGATTGGVDFASPITSGVWNGTAIGATYGGTGQTSYAIGDLLYANSTSTLAKLADVATGNVLISGGVNTAPSWGKVILGTHTTGNYVSTITGTANQITPSSSTGDITLSIPSDFRAPGTVNAVNGIYTGVTAGTQRIDASGNLVNIGNISASGYATASGSLALGNTTAAAGPGHLNMSGNLTALGTINGLTVSSGTISSGTWNGTAISTTYGGTGQNWSAVAQGSIPYFNGTGTMSTLAPTTSGYVLTTQGTGANPTWTQLPAAGVNYWQLNGLVLSPANAAAYDLAIGGNATGSAFQVFAATGNITTAGDLAINGDNISADGTLGILGATGLNLQATTGTVTIDSIAALQTINMGASNVARTINIGTGTGVDTIHIGDGATGADVITIGSANAGAVTVQSGAALTLHGEANSIIDFVNFDVDASGNIVAAGTIDINGAGTSDIAGTLNLSGNTLTSTGDLTINPTGGNVLLGASDNFVLTSAANLFLDSDTAISDTGLNDAGSYLVGVYDDFSYSNSTNVQGVLKDLDTAMAGAGVNHWQLNSNVLSPVNVSNDLAIGGNATASAKFAVMGTTGNISTANNTIDWTLNNAADALNIDSNTLSIDALNNRVGIGTIGPDSPLDVLSTGGSQVRLTYTDGSVYTTLNTDSSGNLTIDATGTKSIIADDLQVTGNDILDSGAATRISLGATTTLTNTTTTLSGTTTLTASSLTTLTTSASLAMSSTTGLTLGGNPTVYGGTGASGTLRIDSTSNATKGNVSFNGTSTYIDGLGNLKVGGYATASASLALGNTTAATGPGHLNMSGNLTVGGTTTFGGYTYTWPTTGQSSSYVLSTNGTGTLSWAPQTASGINHWQLANNVLAPINVSNDLTIGGNSTASAKFQVFGATGNITSAGTASVSGTLTLGNGSKIQSAYGPLTLNYKSGANTWAAGLILKDVSGDIDLAGGSSATGCTISNSTGNIACSGSINGLTVSSGTISSGTWNGTAIGTQYGGTGQNWSSVARGSIPYFNNTGTMTTLAPSTSGYVLQTNGAGADPSWVSSSTVGINHWQLANNVLAPINVSNDLTIGGNSTASAKFQVFGATGNATMSGSLTLGYGQSIKSAYGPLNLSYKSGANAWSTGLTLADVTGNVGIGTTSPSEKLSVAGKILIDDGVNNAELVGKNGLIIKDSGTGGTALQVGVGSGNSNPNYIKTISVNPGNSPWVTVEGGDTNIGLKIWSKGVSDVNINNVLTVQRDGNVGINTTSPLSKLSVVGTATNAIGKAAFLVDQYESQDILTASASGQTKMTLKNDGTLSLYNATSTISNTSGDITLNAASNLISFSGDDIGNIGKITASNVINVGGLSGVAYNALAGAGDAPASSAITATNDVFVGGDLELKGGLYLTGKNIFNVVSGVSTGTITLASDPTLNNSFNSLSYGSWLVNNSTNNGLAALMVNQAKGGDIFSASASGTTKFTISNAGNVQINSADPLLTFNETDNVAWQWKVSGDQWIIQRALSDQVVVTPTSFIFKQAYLKNNDDALVRMGSAASGSELRLIAGAESDYLTIQSDGDVGIGTTTPSTKLTLYGTNADFLLQSAGADIGDIIFRESDGNQKGRIWTGSTAGVGGEYMYLSSGDNSGDIMIDSDGYVGIGGVDPTGMNLEVLSSLNGAGIRALNSAALGTGSGGALWTGTSLTPSAADQRIGGLYFSGSNSSSYAAGSAVTGWSGSAWSTSNIESYLKFETTPNAGTSRLERMRITSAGNVGIGTTSAGNKLTVYASASNDGIYNTDGTRWTLQMAGTAGAGSYNGLVQANDNAMIFSAGSAGTGALVIAPWNAGAVGMRMNGSGNTSFYGSTLNATGFNSMGDQESMIPNAGFEVNDDTTTTVADAWSLLTNTTGSNPSVTTDSLQGLKAQTLYGTSTTDMSIITPCIPITSGATYNYYAWTKASVAPGDGFYLSIIRYSDGNCTTWAGQNDQVANSNLTTSWAKYGGTTAALTGKAVRLRISNYQPNTTSTFTIDSVRFTPSALTNTIDIAENYYTNETLIPGQLVKTGSGATSEVSATTQGYESNLMGIISTNPAMTLGEGITGSDGQQIVRVALSGRVPVIISSKNGDIKSGDYITSYSGLPGVGTKSVKAGRVVGMALEDKDWETSSCQTVDNYSDIIWPSDSGSDNEARPCYQLSDGSYVGKIMVFINPTWNDPGAYLADSGELQIVGQENTGYQLADASGTNIIETIGAFAKAIAANIEAGAIVTKDLTTTSFTAFQGTVDNMLVKSGLVARRIETKLISPIPGEDLAVELPDDSKFKVQDSSQNVVASIDNQGNATFSGTLYAEEIKSKSLDEIRDILTKVETDQALLSQAADWSVNTATDSAIINEQLAVNNLFVTGQAAMTSLSLSQSLSIGTDMVFSSTIDNQELAINSIDTLSYPLRIQSLAMAPVEIMAGLIKIDTLGNVQIAGNLAVGGKIQSTGLSLQEENLQANQQAASGSALLTLQNSSGNTVSSVDASGSAVFNSISTQGLTIAGAVDATNSAIINGVITTNATAGSGVIPAYTSQITIKNQNVTDYTLVYVTPTSSTNNYVLYVKSKSPGEFVVGFTDPISVDVNFNWWIVKVAQ